MLPWTEIRIMMHFVNRYPKQGKMEKRNRAQREQAKIFSVKASLHGSTVSLLTRWENPCQYEQITILKHFHSGIETQWGHLLAKPKRKERQKAITINPHSSHKINRNQTMGYLHSSHQTIPRNSRKNNG